MIAVRLHRGCGALINPPFRDAPLGPRVREDVIELILTCSWPEEGALVRVVEANSRVAPACFRVGLKETSVPTEEVRDIIHSRVGVQITAPDERCAADQSTQLVWQD